MLDQLVSPTDPDLAAASSSLCSALIAAAPSGCDVGGMLPAARPSDDSASAPVDGLAEVWRAPVAGRELAHAWRWGVPLGSAQGMIHSPTLLAPLVRHDRVHDHDQTVVTLWSLEAWAAPARLARGAAAWQKAMLGRAVRHADAVVVPTHAMAAQLAEIAPLGARIRVIAGAPEAGFAVPVDAPNRVLRAGVGSPYIIALGSAADSDELAAVFARAALLGVEVVVLGAGADDSALIVDRAQASGLTERRVHTIARPDASDRAALFAGALAVVALSTAPAYPWRLLEALAAGAPIIAAATAQHEELLADAAHFADPGDSDAAGALLSAVVEDEDVARRLRVLSQDRSRAFAWTDSAQRVWQLHAEL
ncbi:Glycosyl transferase group 1 [Microbacterium sp. C448]|nr:Glycosyl transferase group 1 [Microbacterium sp. C448]